VVAALSVTGPRQQFDGDALNSVIAAVRDHAHRLSMKLGFLGS
jgi:DNA-binding IclR family transcriptional regulator